MNLTGTVEVCHPGQYQIQMEDLVLPRKEIEFGRNPKDTLVDHLLLRRVQRLSPAWLGEVLIRLSDVF
jgi:hypothetical protein